MASSSSTPIESRREFQEAVRRALIEAAEADARQMWFCDADFTHWPLNEVSVVQSVSRWAARRHKLTVIASSFNEVIRSHPRWVAARTAWSSQIECLQVNETESSDVPSMLLLPGHCVVRLFDPVKFRGSVSRDPADLLRARERADVISQQSAESFPATTLGL